MDASFRNKVVIITGASAGVGAACARRFSACGAKLMLVARGEAALKAIADELGSDANVRFLAMDVADAESCRRLLTQTKQAFGAVHVLVNNAGLHARGEVEECTEDDLVRMVRVNLEAPVRLARLAIPLIRDAGGGAIVNVASLAGCTPVPGSTTYAATKAGLRSFSYGLHDELEGSGIHVGVVSPGPIDTGFIMDELDRVSDLSLSQPMSTAEEVAEAILDIAAGKRVERKMPTASGLMANMVYLFPALRRATAPLLRRKGRRAREDYKRRLGRTG